MIPQFTLSRMSRMLNFYTNLTNNFSYRHRLNSLLPSLQSFYRLTYKNCMLSVCMVKLGKYWVEVQNIGEFPMMHYKSYRSHWGGGELRLVNKSNPYISMSGKNSDWSINCDTLYSPLIAQMYYPLIERDTFPLKPALPITCDR